VEIAITGASGLVGSALVSALRRAGHRAVPVVRPQSGDAADALHWDPEHNTIDAAGFEGLDGVVHLAGVSIGDKRWTDAQKRRVLESRTGPTTLLAETLAGLDRPPAVLVSASAVGWYGGIRGSQVLTEKSPPPDPPDFLSDVCRQWEEATTPAAAAGIRTVQIRSGVVLAAHGGMLQRILLPYKLGLGGRIASGEQYMSWIALDDEVGAILHALTHVDLAGPVNATSPSPVTNAEFTATLGRVLKRPTVIPTPVPGLKLVYGAELVQHLLIEGQRVLPERLEESGYTFERPDLAFALRHLLGVPATT
jgi:uncharacterized protein (TIGR01777 family)